MRLVDAGLKEPAPTTAQSFDQRPAATVALGRTALIAGLPLRESAIEFIVSLLKRGATKCATASVAHGWL
jgi:hypothetical protein